MSTERDALRAAIDALEEIALAGMSGSGQESEEGMRDWHARRAWQFISIAARALETVRQAAQASPSLPPVQVGAEAVCFEGYLCKAWGETELPCAEVVADLAGVRHFIVREWLNDEKAEDLPAIMADIEASIEREKAWYVQFEIGGASVEPVYSFAARSANQGEAQ